MDRDAFGEFMESWLSFRSACEKKTKGRCDLNNPAWRKLRDYHLDNFLKNHKNPYLFLFTMKMEYRDYYISHKMGAHYTYYAKLRTQSLNPLVWGPSALYKIACKIFQ